MIPEIILLVLLHYFIEIVVIVLVVFIDLHFNNKKNGSFAIVAGTYLRVPSILVGLYISSYWGWIITPFVIYFITRLCAEILIKNNAEYEDENE